MFIPCLIFVGDNLLSSLVTQYFFVDATPDVSEWTLSNEKYTVCPVLTDETITFYVENKNGNIIFAADEIWRDWDFKSLSIDENSVIVADSSDVGTYIYKENGNGSFYLVEPIFDE